MCAVYEEEWFLAEIAQDQVNVPENHSRLSFMKIKGRNTFAWDKPDIFEAPFEDIILKVTDTELKNSRGHIGLNKQDLEFVESTMVVIFILQIIQFLMLGNVFY